MNVTLSILNLIDMKKIAFFLFIALSASTIAQADKHVKPEELPRNAKCFLQSYFSESEIQQVIKESNSNDYEVTTEDGKEFDFDYTGQWKAVDCNFERVPSPLVPKQILNRVAKQYGPETQIVWIRRTRKGGFRVELSNGVEVAFNKRFKVIPVK